MRLIAYFSIFITAFSIGKANDLKEALLDLAAELDSACELYDLTFPNDFRKALILKMDKSLTINELETLAKDLRPGFTERVIYRPNPTVDRDMSQKVFYRFIYSLKKNGVNLVQLDQLKQLVEELLLDFSKNRKIGHCYTIQIKQKPLIASKLSVEIDYDTQKEIEKLFKRTNLYAPLSELESKMLSSGKLTESELLELRAIRLATKIFEENTLLRKDKAGGFFTNLFGEVFGLNQLACTDEAETYQMFLESLYNQGLLKFFIPVGQISMRPSFKKDWAGSGHVATKILNKRDGAFFVLDSWYEKGGEAAHILTKEEWEKLPVTPVNVFKKIVFKDVAEAI